MSNLKPISDVHITKKGTTEATIFRVEQDFEYKAIILEKCSVIAWCRIEKTSDESDWTLRMYDSLWNALTCTDSMTAINGRYLEIYRTALSEMEKMMRGVADAR